MSNSFYHSTFTAAIGSLAKSGTIKSQFTAVEAGFTAAEAALAPKASPAFTGSATLVNIAYTGTLTGGAGIVNLGSGQFYKDAAGLVGVGTATPQVRLSAATTGDAVGISVGEAGSATGKTLDIGYFIAADYGRIQAVHAGTGFKTLALNPSGGSVGIGTTTPGARLEVSGSGAVARITGTAGTAPRLELSSAGVVGWTLRANNSATSEFTIFQDATERVRISSAGNVTIAAPSSGVALTVSGALALSAPTYVGAGTYTVLATDSSIRFAATCTVTLPSAASFPGRILRTANIGAFAITSASANVGQQVTGAADTAILPATAGKWAELHSDGSFWYMTASN